MGLRCRTGAPTSLVVDSLRALGLTSFLHPAARAEQEAKSLRAIAERELETDPLPLEVDSIAEKALAQQHEVQLEPRGSRSICLCLRLDAGIG